MAGLRQITREPLKTSVFRGFLTLWRKLHLRNFLYIKELAIFSEESLKTQPGFLEIPMDEDGGVNKWNIEWQ
jgi:hypothetical protein